MPDMTTRRCWHCDNAAHMTLRHKALISTLAALNHQVQAVFSCDECRYLQIAEGRRVQESLGARSGQNWETGLDIWLNHQTEDSLTWWPQVGVSRPFEDVPEHIADAASEAHRCYSIQAYRGATALARAVIEASAKAKGITKGTLYSKIEELEKQNHVRPHIKEAAHEVRHLGNDVAHGDFVDPIESEEAEETLALMAEVLQEVFQSPARIERAKQKRIARKAGSAAADPEA
jgi:hypothetical protein